MRIPSSLTGRLVLSAALWTVLALAIGGVLLSLIFRSYVEKGFDARLTILLDSLIAEVTVGSDGALAMGEPLPDPRFRQPYSGWYWQVTPTYGRSLRSRSLWDETLRPQPGYTGEMEHRYYTDGPEGDRLRVIERDVTLPGSDAAYRFSVAAETSEIRADIRRFNTFVFWSLAGLGFGLIAAVFIQVRYGLRPLRVLRAALANVRSGHAQRLEGALPDEIQPLVDETNALLEHNELVVARARTHVGNLAHALKTPLSVMTNEVRAGRANPALAKQLEAMQKHIDYYLSQARAAARGSVVGTRTEVRPVIDDLSRTLKRIHRDKEIDISLEGDLDAVFRGERQDLEEMLGNLLDNACKWARARVAVVLRRSGETVIIDIDDDGPGIPEAERASVFGRGNRIDEAKPGAGLGLAIVSDVAQMCGGRVDLADSPLGGLRARLVLPAAL